MKARIFSWTRCCSFLFGFLASLRARITAVKAEARKSPRTLMRQHWPMLCCWTCSWVKLRFMKSYIIMSYFKKNIYSHCAMGIPFERRKDRYEKKTLFWAETAVKTAHKPLGSKLPIRHWTLSNYLNSRMNILRIVSNISSTVIIRQQWDTTKLLALEAEEPVGDEPTHALEPNSSESGRLPPGLPRCWNWAIAASACHGWCNS